jgi:hypothetical protein
MSYIPLASGWSTEHANAETSDDSDFKTKWIGLLIPAVPGMSAKNTVLTSVGTVNEESVKC